MHQPLGVGAVAGDQRLESCEPVLRRLFGRGVVADERVFRDMAVEGFRTVGEVEGISGLGQPGDLVVPRVHFVIGDDVTGNELAQCREDVSAERSAVKRAVARP